MVLRMMRVMMKNLLKGPKQLLVLKKKSL